jgi:hypothetical protein
VSLGATNNKLIRFIDIDYYFVAVVAAVVVVAVEILYILAMLGNLPLPN